MIAGDRIGCLTVVEVLEAAQARDRDLRGYAGRPPHPSAMGTHVLVRCACLLEFLVRARELSRRKKVKRCGSKCELGKAGRGEKFIPEWLHCRNPMCGADLNPGGMGRPNRTGFCQPCKSTRGVRRWYEITRPNAAGKVARQIANHRHIKQGRIASGLCTQCGVPCSGLLCEMHRERNNANARRRRARCRRAGFCESCRRLAAPGKWRCPKHLAMGAKLAAERYWRKQESERVGACG